jgi:dihydroflavonol-4-reductase
VLNKRYPIVMPGGMHIADVRDVASRAGRGDGAGARRSALHGYRPLRLHARPHTHARRPHRASDPLRDLPAWFLAAFGRAADVAQRRVRTRLPWDAEGMWVMNCAARCDDSKTWSEFALKPRPLRQTLADTVRWLVEVGHLTPGQAGRLA